MGDQTGSRPVPNRGRGMRFREKKRETAFKSRINDLEDNMVEVGALADASSFMTA